MEQPADRLVAVCLHHTNWGCDLPVWVSLPKQPWVRSEWKTDAGVIVQLSSCKQISKHFWDHMAWEFSSFVLITEWTPNKRLRFWSVECVSFQFRKLSTNLHTKKQNRLVSPSAVASDWSFGFLCSELDIQLARVFGPRDRTLASDWATTDFSGGSSYPLWVRSTSPKIWNWESGKTNLFQTSQNKKQMQNLWLSTKKFGDLNFLDSHVFAAVDPWANFVFLGGGGRGEFLRNLR